jgi:hypothetical protein
MAQNADARAAVPGAAASALGQEIVAAENSATAINGQAGALRLEGRVFDALTRYAGARAAWERDPTPENNQRRLRVLRCVAAAKEALRSRGRP